MNNNIYDKPISQRSLIELMASLVNADELKSQDLINLYAEEIVNRIYISDYPLETREDMLKKLGYKPTQRTRQIIIPEKEA